MDSNSRTKNKPKKSEIFTQTIMETIDAIKSKWPEYTNTINVDHLRSPQKDFVLRIYQNIVTYYWNLVSRVANEDITPQYPPQMEYSLALYNQLNEIASIRETGFKLGDLYAFDPCRTTHFIHLAMHFIIFAETFIEDTLLPITSGIHRALEEFEVTNGRLELVQEELSKLYTESGQLKEKDKKLTRDLEQIDAEYDKIILIQKEEDKMYEENDRELKAMLEEIEMLEKQNEALEQKESDLKDELLPEEEYLHLKSLFEAERNEEKNMEEEEDAIGKWLTDHKSASDHVKECLTEMEYLSQIELPYLELREHRQVLNEAQQSYDHTVETIKGLDETELQTLSDELKLEVVEMEKDIKNLYEQLLQNKEKFTIMMKKSSEANSKESEVHIAKIGELRDVIDKYEREIHILEEGLIEKKNDMKKVLERVIQKTRKHLQMMLPQNIAQE